MKQNKFVTIQKNYTNTTTGTKVYFKLFVKLIFNKTHVH